LNFAITESGSFVNEGTCAAPPAVCALTLMGLANIKASAEIAAITGSFIELRGAMIASHLQNAFSLYFN
jgi:hypothetical protein